MDNICPEKSASVVGIYGIKAVATVKYGARKN